MNGKVAAGSIVVTALVAGVAMYWLQVYAFYREENLAAAGPVTVVLRDGTTAELPVMSFQAIDSDSSPRRFRSCFTTDAGPQTLGAAVPYDAPTPLNAPGWFDCFDARAIDEALVSGAMQAYLSIRDIRPGFDRVVAIRDGRVGYAWHQPNDSLED